MKTKKLLSTLFLFANLIQQAQSGLNNMSFENWSTGIFGSAPTGWLGFGISKETTGAKQGNNYIRLSNTVLNEGGLMLGTATATASTIKGGVAYIQSPLSIIGFYKTSGLISTDSVGISAYTSKSGSIVALAMLSLKENTSGWTSFSMPFVTYFPGPVDSIFIMASSGKLFVPDKNSLTVVFDLDNLAFAQLSNIDEASFGTAFIVYPNPASNELNIVSKEEIATSVLIIDMNGKVIDEVPIEVGTTTMNLQKYHGGVYTYSILDKEKSSLLRSRFVIKKG